MLHLYFGSKAAIQTTVLVLVFLGFAGCAYVKRAKIHHWGWLILAALALGLYLCVVAATRDGYHLSVQHAIDASTAPGLFTITSVQSVFNCVLAGVIVLCGVLCLFLRSESARQVLFFVLCAGVTAKILMIELSRLVLFFMGRVY